MQNELMEEIQKTGKEKHYSNLKKGHNVVSVNNILFKHTDTYRIYINNLHTQMYITVI